MSAPVSPQGQSRSSAAAIGRPAIPIPDRILVVRLSAMGDIIHAMPAIAALRGAQPQIKIGWLIEERWAELLCLARREYAAERSQFKPLADWIHVANFKRLAQSVVGKAYVAGDRNAPPPGAGDALRSGARPSGRNPFGTGGPSQRRQDAGWLLPPARRTSQHVLHTAG